MNNPICRWGILGTAVIARKTWKAMQLCENARLVAVASRGLSRAQEFVAACQSYLPTPDPVAAIGGYQELLNRDDIDAVYIPLPTGLRKEWVIQAAEAGKHVLCEKPCAINAQDLRVMIATCNQNRVQFMDGVMYMHSQRLKSIRQSINQGEIGDIKRIAMQFSFCAPDDFRSGNIRTDSALEPQGCLGDLGWYMIRFALWTLDWKLPIQVRARLLDKLKRDGSQGAVPMELSAEMLFPGGVSASFYCSFQTHHQQWASISGNRGFLFVPDFVLPFFGAETAYEIHQADFVQLGCDFNMEKRARRIVIDEYSNSHTNSQETNLIRTFSRLATSSPDPHWPHVSMLTQQVMDACLESALNDRAVELQS